MGHIYKDDLIRTMGTMLCQKSNGDYEFYIKAKLDQFEWAALSSVTGNVVKTPRSFKPNY